jgi:hypothetical protein
MSDLIISLRKATAYWLAYKKETGMGDSLSEALIIIPVAECLHAQGYQLKTEKDTTEYGVGTAGLFNYDAIASKGKDTILIELKYLTRKNTNDKRLYNDVLKLALPEPQCRRFLIVAGKSEILSESGVIKKLRAKPILVVSRATALKDDEMYLEDQVTTEELKSFVQKAKAYSLPGKLRARLTDPTEINGEASVIIEVQRFD